MTRPAGFIMLLAMLAIIPICHATIITYDTLLSGPAESPPNASPGTGFAEVTLDTVANTLHVQITFIGLSGTTIGSHINCCTAVPFIGTAMVATTTPTFPGFPFGLTSGTYVDILDLTSFSSWNPSFITASGGTTAGAEAVLVAGLAVDEAYLNIRSTVDPGGEIRGFLAVRTVPEPATLALLGIAIAGLGFSRRRKPD